MVSRGFEDFLVHTVDEEVYGRARPLGKRCLARGADLALHRPFRPSVILRRCSGFPLRKPGGEALGKYWCHRAAYRR